MNVLAGCRAGVVRKALGVQTRGILRRFSADAAPAVKIKPGAIEIASAQAAKRRELPNIWLRDNCRCSSCVNQDTLQRNFNTFEIPADIIATEVHAEKNGLRVKWSADNHESLYPWDLITHYQNNDYRFGESIELHLWSGAEIKDAPPTVAYQDAMNEASEKGIASLTSKIRVYGFAFVEGVPHENAEDTKKLLERIAFIRETHYGGFYDFIPDLAKADTAYTNIALPAHTDNTYFTDPSGLQAFHMLSHIPPPNHSPKDGPMGGESLLVDSFYAAKTLKEQDPDAYDILSKVRLPWHASGNEGITISPDKRYPVLELSEGTGELHRVRWNNDDRGVVPFDSGIDPVQWYNAARKWEAILRRPDVEYWTQLKPGQTLIFDNWRVMHGRSAFVGMRRMSGAYINRDDFISRWRNTNYPREEVLKRVIG